MMDFDSLPDPSLKLCKVCNQWKPATKEIFVTGKKSRNGLKSLCKECRRLTRKDRKYPPVPEGHRRCSRCRRNLPATSEFFTARGRAKSGLCEYCKQCVSDMYQENLQASHDDRPTVMLCRECNVTYSFTEEYFYKNGKNKYGLFTICKTCHGKQGKRYRQANREGTNARARGWRTRNRERGLVIERKSREKNRQQRREQERKRRLIDPERFRKNKWRYNHSEHGRMMNRIHSRTRKARIKGAGGKITSQDVQRQFKAQKGKCYYCHKRLAKFHIEHVTPVTRGGSNDPSSNIVLACPSCNLKKGTKLPHEWPEGGRLF